MGQERIKILVGEPWNFKSKAGKNLIVGNIIKVIKDKTNRERMLIKSDYDIKAEGIKSKYFILSNRFTGDKISEIYKGVDLNINGGILPNECLNYNDNELVSNAKFAIIGSVQLIH